MLKDFKKAGRKIKNHLIHSTSHNGISGAAVDCGHYPAPAIDRFAEINYYRCEFLNRRFVQLTKLT